MDLAELKIVVTGAARGMGRHFATALLEAGAHVVASDVDEAGLRTLADEVDAPQRLRTVTCDVSSEPAVEAMIRAAAEAFGGLNGLINNAGLFRDGLLVKPDKETGAIAKMSLADWQKVIDVDLTGPFLCTREFAAQAIERQVGPAVVVNISSVARHGNVGQSNYSAAKAGLVADTRLWGNELARYGIRVGAVAPGFVETPILDGMRDDVLQKMLRGVPLRRVGTPHELWQAVKFVLECDYFTGKCIDVDGGLSL